MVDKEMKTIYYAVNRWITKTHESSDERKRELNFQQQVEETLFCQNTNATILKINKFCAAIISSAHKKICPHTTNLRVSNWSMLIYPETKQKLFENESMIHKNYTKQPSFRDHYEQQRLSYLSSLKICNPATKVTRKEDGWLY